MAKLKQQPAFIPAEATAVQQLGSGQAACWVWIEPRLQQLVIAQEWPDSAPEIIHLDSQDVEALYSYFQEHRTEID